MLSDKHIRRLCAGVNQINLANKYLDHMHVQNKKWIFRSTVEPLPVNYYCVQTPSLKSRMSSGGPYTSYLLFDKITLVDSMCTCNNFARSVPCAHRGTVLVVLARKQCGQSLIPKETASLKKRKTIIIPKPSFAGGWADQRAKTDPSK